MKFIKMIMRMLRLVFLEEKVSYEVAIEAVKKIAMSGMFERQSSEEENNTRYLEKKLADYKAGKLKVEEHELIEE